MYIYIYMYNRYTYIYILNMYIYIYIIEHEKVTQLLQNVAYMPDYSMLGSNI